jgi:hypothetical protein
MNLALRTMPPNRLHAEQTTMLNYADSRAAGDGNAAASATTEYELCFRSLFAQGLGYAFPCDAAGQVDLDGLSERARNCYYYARSCVGREFHMQAVLPASPH